MVVRRIQRKHRLQDEREILLLPGAGLEDGDAGRRMRHEHRTQTVTFARAEAGDLRSDVRGETVAGGHREDKRFHALIVAGHAVTRARWWHSISLVRDNEGYRAG